MEVFCLYFLSESHTLVMLCTRIVMREHLLLWVTEFSVFFQKVFYSYIFHKNLIFLNGSNEKKIFQGTSEDLKNETERIDYIVHQK